MMTPTELTGLLVAECEGIDKSALRIHAESILEHVPHLAGILQTISAEPKDNHGRKAAFARLRRNLHDFSFDTYPKVALCPPHEIKRMADNFWGEKNQLQDDDLPVADIYKCWAFTNAAYETAQTSSELFTQNPFDDLIYRIDDETFATRYHYRHLRGDIDTLPEDILTTTYWRGLAAYGRIGWWIDDTRHGHEFIMWAGEQEDLNSVILAACDVNSMEIDEIKALIKDKVTASNALPSIEEVESILKRNAVISNLTESMNSYSSRSELKRVLCNLPEETLASLGEYQKSGLSPHRTGDFLVEETSVDRINEALYFAMRFNMTVTAYGNVFAPSLRYYTPQLGYAKDYSANKDMLEAVEAFIIVTKALLTAESKYGWDEDAHVWTTTSDAPKVIRDSRLVNLIVSEPQKAHLMAEIITQRNIRDYKKLVPLMDELSNGVSAIREGIL